ncbi:MAG: murein peptide amidase A [Gammaproteobacteria bacterium]|nr:murein peptide amidase A [Gammaproteobacteria bacterium]
MAVTILLSCFFSAQAINVQAADVWAPTAVMTPVDESPHFSPALDKLDSFRNYLLNLYDVNQLCRQIDEKLSSISYTACINSDLDHSGAYSNKRKVIAYRDFKPASGPTAGRVLLVGGIHGDEYSSVTIVFKWLQDFNGGQFHWRVVPLLNPDGLLMPPQKSQRMNANGVDLNRNFPTPNWEKEAVDYWVNRTRKSKRRYPGTAALSEPESRWLSEQIDTFKPDAVISVHAPHGIVDFDGPQVPPDNLGPLELRLLGTYPGSMGRYIGVFKGIPLLTVELESALRLPEDDDVERIWSDTIAWLNDRVVPRNESEDTLLTEDTQRRDSSTRSE